MKKAPIILAMAFLLTSFSAQANAVSAQSEAKITAENISEENSQGISHKLFSGKDNASSEAYETRKKTVTASDPGGDTAEYDGDAETAPAESNESTAEISTKTIKWDSSWKYADFSKIHDDTVTLYRASSNRKNKVIAVNAGHGTSDGSKYKTQCHPDGTPKYVTGSTASGAVYSTAIAGGMEFSDGTPEAEMTLKTARSIKDILLENGYDVLMIRDSDDCRLDNIARTVFANENADCHISIHFDSTNSDKGAFYIGVPDIKEYKAMYPVSKYWKKHNRLGNCLIDSLKDNKIKIYSSGYMGIDLTQTSYSTIPSVDLELGDKATAVDDKFIANASQGVLEGVNSFFKK